MKILITGSNGLIGSALSASLCSLGIEVLGLDIGVEPHHDDFGDILDDKCVLDKVSQVDGVVHLAAVSRVVFGERNPKHCWAVNVEGTEKILRAALESKNRPWVLFASSREVYGEPDSFPVKETDPLNPINTYGKSKKAAEQAVEDAQQRGLKASTIRFSNVYGSVHDHQDRVIPAFCAAAVRGSNIRVDGKQKLFDFTFIDDVVQGMLSCIDALSESKDPLPPIHLGTGHGVSLGEAAAYAQEVSSFNIQVLEAPSRVFDVSGFVGDPSRAKDLLNWEACVPIKEGIHRLIHQYRLFAKACQSEYV